MKHVLQVAPDGTPQVMQAPRSYGSRRRAARFRSGGGWAATGTVGRLLLIAGCACAFNGIRCSVPSLSSRILCRDSPHWVAATMRAPRSKQDKPPKAATDLRFATSEF